eukprot:m.84911 g.84911  ORF g.84911 m.84911 type:complete len:428 (+) comp19748_c0_seq2:263-1546(+)
MADAGTSLDAPPVTGPSSSRVSKSRVRGPRADVAAASADSSAPVSDDGSPPPLTRRTNEEAVPTATATADPTEMPQPKRRVGRRSGAAGVATNEGSDTAPATNGTASSAAPALAVTDEGGKMTDDAGPLSAPDLAASERASAKQAKKDKKSKKKEKREKKKKAETTAEGAAAGPSDDAGAGVAETAAVGEAAAPAAATSTAQSPAEAAMAAAADAAQAAGDAPEAQFKGRVQRTAASDAHGSLTGVFMVTFSGQIVSADFPFQDSLWCKYKFRYGKDWHPISGTQEGMSQATRRSSDGRHVCVWNFPVEVTFKSTNPFGWPQIVVVVSGIDSLGRDVVRGYGSQHLPLGPGIFTRVVPTFVPVPSSTLERLSGYILGTRAEFVEDKFVAGGTGREVTRVRSQGTVKLSVSVVTKDFGRYGFRAGDST